MFKRTAFNRKLFFITADIVLVSLAVWISFLLRFDGFIPEESFLALKTMLILALVFHIPVFYFFNLYSFSWSYVSSREVVSIFFASTFSFLFLSLAIFFSRDFQNFQGFPRSTIFIKQKRERKGSNCWSRRCRRANCKKYTELWRQLFAGWIR